MHKSFLLVAIIFNGIAVILGAFGAHKLKEIISEKALNIFETAVRYQFYHALALLLTAILFKEFPNKFTTTAGNLFIAGIILFSGSLYALTYKTATNIDSLKWVGPLTPLGGLCFISGWVCLAIAVIKH